MMPLGETGQIVRESDVLRGPETKPAWWTRPTPVTLRADMVRVGDVVLATEVERIDFGSLTRASCEALAGATATARCRGQHGHGS